MGFENQLRLPASGDPVSASSVNLPFRSIDQNVRYLYSLLQASRIGSTVYALQKTLEAEAAVGMAVWYNPALARFERGLGTVDVNETTGVVTPAAQAQIWGIVARKTSTTLGDILLFGMDTVDISAATDNVTSAGVYYLSGTRQGYLTKSKPPVGIAVLRATGTGEVFVFQNFIDYLDRHTHQRFELVCRPAGDTSQPAPGDRHIVENADDILPGWLPAGHAVFAGNAPAGAAFGYNLSAHPALQAAWPPIPAGNAYLEWSKGISTDTGFTGVPLGSAGLCVIDANGLWWMSDCYADVPWPIDLDTSVSDSYSDSSSIECPRHLDMAMQLWFSKPNFSTDATAVLSLRATDTRIKIYCRGTATPATAGHLDIALALNLVVTDNAVGSHALKTFDPASSTFTRGPICEGLWTAAENVILSGTIQAVRSINGTPRTVHQGLVAVTLIPEASVVLDVQTVRLDGAETEFYQDTMYIAFRPEEADSFRGMVKIPETLAITSPTLSLRFLLLGRAAGTLPALELTARRVPRPATDEVVDLPTSADEFDVTLDAEKVLSDANQYVEVTSEDFSVVAGDTVYFSLSRADDDGYAAEVGVLRQSGVLAGA